MKKIFYIASVVALSMTMSACNDFLDLTPQGTENSGNYFNSAENAEIAVNGIYDVLQYDEGNGPDGQWVTGHFDFFLGDMTSDDAEKGSTDTDNTPLLRIIGGTSDSSLEQAEAFWIHGFWGVSRANFVIEGLQSVSWDSSLRDRYMGEALFLRAYFNWYLVRMFGPIPLFTRSIQPSDFGTVGRTSVNQAYAQIAADLTEAAKLLPARSKYASADLGRATKGAAQALLARVYMYQIGTDPDNTAIGWKQVYDAADEVIKSGEYKLMSNMQPSGKQKTITALKAYSKFNSATDQKNMLRVLSEPTSTNIKATVFQDVVGASTILHRAFTTNSKLATHVFLAQFMAQALIAELFTA